MKPICFAALLALFSITAFAQEGSLVGGLGFGGNHYSEAPPAGITYGSKTGFVLKGTSDIMPLGPVLLRGGLFFENRGFKRTSASGDSFTQYHSLGVTAEAAYTSLPFVSFSGGLYLSTGMGKVTTTLSDGTSSEAEFSDVALSKGDYGLKAGVRGKYPVLPILSAVLDLDYLFGFKDLSTVAGKMNRRDLWVLVGASYEF